jgi:F-type H+-transporting ATPase subunit a
MAGPLEQFQVKKIVDLPDLFGIDFALTNSTLAMTVAFAVVTLFLTIVTFRPQVVPGRTQMAGEVLFGTIDDLATGIIGPEARRFFPFVFTLFLFIMVMNLLGLFLAFTATSQLAVTATLGVMTIALVIIVGFLRNGFGFFLLFWPSGAPLLLRPVVGAIEFISFLLRPFTLALRLFGNMLGGHVALKVFAGFVVSLGLLAAGGGVSLLGLPVAALSLGGVVALTALEFLVAFLQAFVFAVLTCIYINDVVNLGHH